METGVLGLAAPDLPGDEVLAFFIFSACFLFSSAVCLPLDLADEDLADEDAEDAVECPERSSLCCLCF